MSSLVKARRSSGALVDAYRRSALRMKDVGMSDRLVSPTMMSIPADWQQQARSRESYMLYRSWVYAAINALAQRAASQPVCIGRKAVPADEEKRRALNRMKSFILRRMTDCIRRKSSSGSIEMLDDHPAADWLERPNSMQSRSEFVQSFVANLNLTGRAYVIRDEEDGRPTYWSVPSTWVRPDRSKWPKVTYFVSRPNNVDFQTGEPVDASRVGVAYLPNPSDPLGCMSPASSQSAAIRIDDRIQTTQERFMDQGVFPGVIVTVGKNPLGLHVQHPGERPTLSPAQRRMIVGAVRKGMQGVSNYGNPAIVDGLIEAITPFTRTQSEIGWEKSEPTIKARILSAFCVHPFMLGEAINVGGYAQANVIERMFCTRVNVFLDCLSLLMTELVGREEGGEGIVAWWEKAEAKDPQIESSAWREGRANGDVTRDEWRAARLNLPPSETDEEAVLGTGAITLAVIQLLTAVGQGLVSRNQAVATLLAMGVSKDQATRIAGEGEPEPEIPDEMGEAVGALGEAVAALREPLQLTAERIVGELV